MKLTYFYATIEVAPRDGYSESLQCSTDRDNPSKLKFTFPYGEITPEQAAAVNEFTKTLTDAFNVLQSQINKTNRQLQLEQYAPQVSTTASPQEDLDKLSELSAVAQPLRGGSDTTDDGQPLTMETASDDEEKLKAMLASGLKEELEKVETGSDKA